MTVKIRAPRCGVARGPHWPGCWGPAVTTNVRPGGLFIWPFQWRLGRSAKGSGVLSFRDPSPTQRQWHGRRVLAVGCEGKCLAVSVA
jgi:hypothetical protein